MKLLRALLGSVALYAGAAAAQREVAITIDDLPRGGDSAERSLAAVRAMTGKLLRPFSEQGIRVIGFVNEGRPVDFGPEGLREVLELWLDAGTDLGNHSHSHSHLNINNAPLNYVGRGGFSWIHRWSPTKGMAPKDEPEPAAWVRAAFETR